MDNVGVSGTKQEVTGNAVCKMATGLTVLREEQPVSEDWECKLGMC